jgi:DnaK suppressor protein
MTKKLNAAFKEQLLAQRASLMAQLSDLRGGAVGRAQASAEHFGQKEDSTAQDSSARLNLRSTRMTAKSLTG